MTCEQLYKQALSMLPTSIAEDDSLREYVVGWVNLAMREAFHVENSIRRFEDDPERPVLKTPPSVTSMTDEIPYHTALTEYAFVYFLASLMCKDDDDNYWAQDYRGRYVVALAEAQRLMPESVIDVYAQE